MAIHPSAVIDARATIDPSVEIGPFVVVDGPVSVGAGTRVFSHAFVAGRTSIGRDNVVHPGAVIGHEPQDLSFPGGDSELRIGDRNVFREHCEVHGGSRPGSATVIGSDNYLMSQTHVGHDCRLGDHVILATGATLGGHVEVGDRAFLGGGCVVHQFVRVGCLTMLRGLSRTSRDVPPFTIMDGTHTVRALNRIGLRRAGFGAERIRLLEGAFRRLFRGPTNLRLALAGLESEPVSDDVRLLIDFVRSSRRGVCVGPRQTARQEPASE